jgi:hypothetical protein
LKAPPRWKVSALSATVAPVRTFSVREPSTGVRRAMPSRR